MWYNNSLSGSHHAKCSFLVYLFTEINAGLIGLSLVYTLSLATTVRFIIRMSAEIDGNVRIVQLHNNYS